MKIATIIQTLKDAITNNIICPRTRTDAITLTDNVTRLDNKLTTMDATDTSLGNLISSKLDKSGGTLSGSLYFNYSGNGIGIREGNTESLCNIGTFPEVLTKDVYVTAFRGVNTTGGKRFLIYEGDGSFNSSFMLENGKIIKINSKIVTITAGGGSPEGNVTAPVGSIYLRTDGGNGTTLYKKTSGTGNTGWTAS